VKVVAIENILDFLDRVIIAKTDEHRLRLDEETIVNGT